MKLASTVAIHSPWDGARVGEVARSTVRDLNALMERARRGAGLARAMPRHRRAEVLERASQAVAREHRSFAALIVAESGKTIVQARKEALRCANTLRLSAEEGRRNAGEVIPFDSHPGSEGRHGWFNREPLGIIAAITPYNDPLNLVAHKLGPAIAGGNSVLLKPSELTPLSAVRLVETLIECGLPAEVVTLAVGDAELGSAIVAARDVRMVSFTGGFTTGEAISRTAGLKKLAMDLGGNAPVIVMADSDLDRAVQACVSGAFWAAGQNCIGTQRIFVERPVAARFREALVEATLALRTGDPASEATDMGPMISEAAAQRAHAVVEAALAAGARLLCGHRRQQAVYLPTVIENAPHHCAAWQEEAFAPVVAVEAFDRLDEALALANAPQYSLHAGIFTRDLHVAFEAAARLEAAGVMVNDSSDYRLDAMPFGGFKYGSMGREGVRFAYEDMTQTKVVCFNGWSRVNSTV